MITVMGKETEPMPCAICGKESVFVLRQMQDDILLLPRAPKARLERTQEILW